MSKPGVAGLPPRIHFIENLSKDFKNSTLRIARDSIGKSGQGQSSAVTMLHIAPMKKNSTTSTSSITSTSTSVSTCMMDKDSTLFPNLIIMQIQLQ
eukprot:13054269-Ditylum_brightwellii.AAC.1